jgi:hypothetical protein
VGRERRGVAGSPGVGRERPRSAGSGRGVPEVAELGNSARELPGRAIRPGKCQLFPTRLLVKAGVTPARLATLRRSRQSGQAFARRLDVRNSRSKSRRVHGWQEPSLSDGHACGLSSDSRHSLAARMRVRNSWPGARVPRGPRGLRGPSGAAWATRATAALPRWRSGAPARRAKRRTYGTAYGYRPRSAVASATRWTARR